LLRSRRPTSAKYSPAKKQLAAPAAFALALRGWAYRSIRHGRCRRSRTPSRTLPKHPAQLTLVGRSVLYCWESVGWCVGLITKANLDKRHKMDREVVNFFVYYEIDDNTSKHALSLDEYGGENPSAWALLEAIEIE
jgi:hypothetical protein